MASVGEGEGVIEFPMSKKGQRVSEIGTLSDQARWLVKMWKRCKYCMFIVYVY